MPWTELNQEYCFLDGTPLTRARNAIGR